MGWSQDHKLIADSLDFLDAEAQVRASKSSPNTMFYLPSVFHFLASKANMASGPNSECKDKPNNDKDTNAYHHSSSSSTKDRIDGSLSITSNIRKLIDGKVHLSYESKEFVSPLRDISSQDLYHFTEAQIPSILRIVLIL